MNFWIALCDVSFPEPHLFIFMLSVVLSSGVVIFNIPAWYSNLNPGKSTYVFSKALIISALLSLKFLDVMFLAGSGTGVVFPLLTSILEGAVTFV